MGTSGPATQLAKATQGCPNSTQPAPSGKSLWPNKCTSWHTYIFATPHHTTNFITPQHTYLQKIPVLSASLLSEQSVIGIDSQKTPTKENKDK
jgi:hypothetical protein